MGKFITYKLLKYTNKHKSKRLFAPINFKYHLNTMAQFQLYNYQFGKIINNEQRDLFGNTSVLMSAKESFPIKQDIFQKIFKDDYNQKRTISYKITISDRHLLQHVCCVQ